MIPQIQTVHVENKLGVVATNMAISDDPVAMGLIINQLIDGIAENKIRYPLREYCANAWDANRSKPFHIQLPSKLDPTLIIRDFGPGLDHNFMIREFMRLGDSTKRTENNSIGSKGLGCKSAFAYTDAFTVRSFQNGTVKAYAIARGTNRIPGLTFIGEFETDEPDGLEVSIPVRNEDVETFRREAQIQLIGFEPTPKILNGNFQFERPKVLMEGKGWKIYQPTNAFRGPHVQMGPMLYPLNVEDQFDKLLRTISHGGYRYTNSTPISNDITYVLEVPIGAIDVTASREGIQYSPMTRKVLEESLNTYISELVVEAQKKIDACDTYFAACVAYNDLFNFNTETGKALGRASSKVLKWRTTDKVVSGEYKFPSNVKVRQLSTSYRSRGKLFTSVSSQNLKRDWQFHVSHMADMPIYVKTPDVAHDWYFRAKKVYEEDSRTSGVILLDVEKPDDLPADFPLDKVKFLHNVTGSRNGVTKLRGTSIIKAYEWDEQHNKSETIRKYDLETEKIVAVYQHSGYDRSSYTNKFGTLNKDPNSPLISESDISQAQRVLTSHGKGVKVVILNEKNDYIFKDYADQITWLGDYTKKQLEPLVNIKYVNVSNDVNNYLSNSAIVHMAIRFPTLFPKVAKLNEKIRKELGDVNASQQIISTICATNRPLTQVDFTKNHPQAQAPQDYIDLKQEVSDILAQNPTLRAFTQLQPIRNYLNDRQVLDFATKLIGA